MAKETTVWIKPLDLPWEQVGTGQFQGITPENVNLEDDTWGPSNATFHLPRYPYAPALDFSAGAEVEVRVAGVNVWDGFVSSTPKKRGDLVTSVVCRGWQDELDGRVFTAGYVHSSLTDYKDARSFPTAPLSNLKVNGTVQVGGAITIGFPKGTAVAVGDAVAATIDLGQINAAKRVVATFENQGVTVGTFTLYIKGHDLPSDIISGGENIASGDPTVLTSPQAGTFSTGTGVRRYVSVILYNGTGAPITPSADALVRITALQLFADTAYESGNASILKADVVIKDALTKGTLALSSDLSGIDPTSFSIPDLWPDPKGLTARELISKVNAYHNWTAKLEPGRRFVFRARTTTPKVKVGEWSALPDDEDASANDITDIYNHCRATSTEPGGSLVVVDRYSKDLSATAFVPASPSLPNPSFDVNVTGWTAPGGGGTITRDTGTYDSAPASALCGGSGGQYGGNAYFTGTFKKGTPYTITCRVQTIFAGSNSVTLRVGSYPNDLAKQSVAMLPGVWTTLTVLWTPTADATIVDIDVTSVSRLYLDSVMLTVNQPTILDRRFRVRSQILDATAALPADGVALTQLADTWLAAHTSTPFKGKQAIQGAQSVRDYLNGDPTAPERLLAMTTDLLHFDDRINPDTGDVGRDGRIVKVSYQPLTDTVQTDVDSTRSDFGALLSRIGVLASAG